MTRPLWIWEHDHTVWRHLPWMLRHGTWWFGSNKTPIFGFCSMWYDGYHFGVHLGRWSFSVSQ
jgi:hypothetical protein